jgi:hypothetical protein
MEEIDTSGSEEPVPANITCPDCGQSYKTPQGLAGHRRLAHATSSAQALAQRTQELNEQRRGIESKTAEVARREAAARRREAELSGRERVAREFEATSAAERLQREIAHFKERLPEFGNGEIVRFDGRDYRVEGGRLEHVYFPNREKHELDEGDIFRIGPHVYWVRSDGGIGGFFSELVAVKLSDGEIVETIFEQEAEPADEAGG